MEHKEFSEAELLTQWEQIGNRYYAIRTAYDPAFSTSMLHRCNRLEELHTYFAHGNWCVGQGFYYKNLCFINQMDGGDEWLAIKDNYDFESITFDGMIQQGRFFGYMQDLMTATKDELLKGQYKNLSL